MRRWWCVDGWGGWRGIWEEKDEVVVCVGGGVGRVAIWEEKEVV